MQILMLILSLIYNLQIKLWPHVLRIAYILYYTEDYEIYTLTSFLMVVMLKRERWCAPSPSISCNCTRPLTEGNICFTWLLTAVRWLWQRPSPSGSFGSGRPISSSTAQPNFKSSESSLKPSKKISPSQTGWGWQNDLACAPGYDLPVQYQTTCRSLGEVEIFPQREFPELLDLLDPNCRKCFWFAKLIFLTNIITLSCFYQHNATHFITYLSNHSGKLVLIAWKLSSFSFVLSRLNLHPLSDLCLVSLSSLPP